MNYPQYILSWTLDALFPVKCLGCGRFPAHLKKEYLCKNCIREIPVKSSFECTGCKTAVSRGKTCLSCQKSNPLDQLLIVSDYNNPLVVKVIKTLKYRFIKETLGPISVIIKKYIYLLVKNKGVNIIEENPVIIPVPMEIRRLNWRGFNQAELIAGSLADILQNNLRNDIIVQTRATKPQAEVKERSERLKKPAGIFKIINSPAVLDRTVVVVDDVCTTGATLNECAKILKEAGAKKVIGFVIARG